MAPGSVVPPGRLIPSKQLWGGNPVSYIKDLDIGELWANYTKSYVTASTGEACRNEFTTWNSAYLQRESSATDLDPDDTMQEPATIGNDYYKYIPKYYI